MSGPEMITDRESVLRTVRERLKEDGGDYYKAAEATLGNGPDLATVGKAMVALAAEHDIAFSAVGARGSECGSAVAVAMACKASDETEWLWFRHQLKGRGTNRWTEGGRIGENTELIVVDSVASPDTVLATDLARQLGARVTAIMPLIESDHSIRHHLQTLHPEIPYLPLLTPEMLAPLAQS